MVDVVVVVVADVVGCVSSSVCLEFDYLFFSAFCWLLGFGIINLSLVSCGFWLPFVSFSLFLISVCLSFTLPCFALFESQVRANLGVSSSHQIIPFCVFFLFGLGRFSVR